MRWCRMRPAGVCVSCTHDYNPLLASSYKPQTKKILQLLRLKQIGNAVFVRVSGHSVGWTGGGW